MIALLALGGAVAAQAADEAIPSAPLAGLAIHHVQISVRDADQIAAWYVSNLGFRITKRVEAKGLKIIWIDIPGFRLGLAQLQGSTRDPSQSIAPPNDTLQQGYRQVHFSVLDVDAAYRFLTAKGIQFLIPPTTYTLTAIRLATMIDPEGNAVSLYQDMDSANALIPRARAPLTGAIK